MEEKVNRMMDEADAMSELNNAGKEDSIEELADRNRRASSSLPAATAFFAYSLILDIW